jgi:hypothetical protein
MRPAALVLLREWFSVICVSHSHLAITVLCALILAPKLWTIVIQKVFDIHL